MDALLSNFVADPQFPCVMAKAAFSKGFVASHVEVGSDAAQAAEQTLDSLYDFVDHFRNESETLSTYTVSFTDPALLNFETFNAFFWDFLTSLKERDSRNYRPDPRVSNNPNSAKFSFSVKGEAFFMLVLHPESPRFARRFAVPTIVFNAHQQFEDLRRKNVFEKVRDLIRGRDKKLQGFINPMLTDYGTKSEVFQYTGKRYGEESKCPFQRLQKWLSFENANHRT